MKNISIQLLIVMTMLISCKSDIGFNMESSENILSIHSPKPSENILNSGNLTKLFTVPLMWWNGDYCFIGPGFCYYAMDQSPWPIFDYNKPLIDDNNYYEESGNDALTYVSLDIENNLISFEIIDIRDGWFEEGGYIDGTFSVSNLNLGSQFADHFDVEEIILNEGIYEMIMDEETGHYLVIINATIIN